MNWRKGKPVGKIKIMLPGHSDGTAAYKKMLEGLGAQVTVVQVLSELPGAEAFDGLVIPGGEDIAPSRYGQENTGCRNIDPEMDELQFAALDLFVKAEKPVLGICNGMQMINIYFGGDLVQDIETRERHQAKEGKAVFHTAAVKPGSWIDSLYKNIKENGADTEDSESRRLVINSSHHQALGRIPDCLEAVMHCDEDGIVEGIRHKNLPVFGLQWHPERLYRTAPDEAALEADLTETVEAGAVDGEKVYRYFLDICGIDRKALIKAAIDKLPSAYAPYSGFHVAAAALFDSGKVYTGVNIENSSYPAGICAERTAISTAVANGERRLKAIAIVGGKDGKMTDYCPPCGICRQVMREFSDPSGLRIILAKSESEYIEKPLEDLLPLSFGPEALL